MSEYEMRVLINELEKLVISQSISLSAKDLKIERLEKEVARLEKQLTPTTHGIEENK